MIPFKFKERVSAAGIDVNNPKYGSFVDKDLHRHTAYQYNKEWEVFLNESDKNKSEIEAFMKSIMEKFF